MIAQIPMKFWLQLVLNLHVTFHFLHDLQTFELFAKQKESVRAPLMLRPECFADSHRVQDNMFFLTAASFRCVLIGVRWLQ